MKYILKKDLPLAKAGTIVETSWITIGWYTTIFSNEEWSYQSPCIANMLMTQIPEWLEEVKEVKTIYDLKKWDTAFFLDSWWEIWQYKLSINWQLRENNITTYFLTEREAKRNKLLRELATREKWLPKEEYELFTTWNWEQSSWDWDEFDMMHYHMWLVFRDKQEYDKWMTPENADLLFKI